MPFSTSALFHERFFNNAPEQNDMSKREKSNREAKKQPLLTPKEKKAAKQAKKHATDHPPLIVRGS